MRLICQESRNIVTKMAPTVKMLETTEDIVEVMASCAPITSLLSRETSDPVCALEKNAMGCSCTWLNTSVRRS